jgi:hypothetical protein
MHRPAKPPDLSQKSATIRATITRIKSPGKRFDFQPRCHSGKGPNDIAAFNRFRLNSSRASGTKTVSQPFSLAGEMG